MRDKVFARISLPLLAFALLLGTPNPPAGQIRVEKDASGRPLITNKGSAPAPAVATPSGGAKASKKGRKPSPERADAERKLRDACAQRGLDFRLISCLVEAESGFNHYTMSKKGAVGLMQLMPGTAKRFGCSDPWDLDQNIEGGTRFLGYLHEYFGGNIPLILAGYNAGEGAVMKYSRKIPPYSETVRYVFTILNRYGSPSLIENAKGSLASPADYDRYYTANRNYKPVTRTYWMYIDRHGVRCFTDAPPGDVECHRVVYKDE